MRLRRWRPRAERRDVADAEVPPIGQVRRQHSDVIGAKRQQAVADPAPKSLAQGCRKLRHQRCAIRAPCLQAEPPMRA